MTEEGSFKSLIVVHPWPALLHTCADWFPTKGVSFRRSRQRNPPVNTRWQATDGVCHRCANGDTCGSRVKVTARQQFVSHPYPLV